MNGISFLTMNTHLKISKEGAREDLSKRDHLVVEFIPARIIPHQTVNTKP
jgi:hypothetical protein